MERRMKLWLACAIVALLIVGAILVMQLVRQEPCVLSANSRTLYEGYVNIEPIPLPILRERLQQGGCASSGDDVPGMCFYREESRDGQMGVSVYPRGHGFGPISFFLTEKMLYATKDIPGAPDIEKFKLAVSKDVQDIGAPVELKETSWVLTKTVCPWDVLY